MTEIEQLRADIDQAKEIMFRFYKQDRQALGLGEMYDRLAKLEAEENAKADPWAEEKRLVKVNLEAWVEGSVNHRMASFSTYLQQRVAELEDELAKRPVVWCLRNKETGEYKKFSPTSGIVLYEKPNPDVFVYWEFKPYTGEQS